MSTPKYDGGAAYPVPMFTRQADGQPMSAGEFFEGGNGMTLRDYFAGVALQAILTQRHGIVGATCADDAYAAADKMLTARNK